MARERVEGLNKLMKDIKKLENMPRKQITKGTRRGANVILKAARQNAPKGETKLLSKNIYLKSEKYKRGKKVFQITFRSRPEFVKITKNGTRYFYPASQEWGFKTRNGGRFEENKHFLINAMAEKQNQAAKVMVDEIGKEIEKSLADGSIR